MHLEKPRITTALQYWYKLTQDRFHFLLQVYFSTMITKWFSEIGGRMFYYLVQTTHVSSRCWTYGRQGSEPQLPSTKYSKAPSLLALVPGTYSGSLSTQTKSFWFGWLKYEVIRYPWYSSVHPVGQSFRAGIISIEPRDLTKQTTQGASWSWRFRLKGYPL